MTIDECVNILTPALFNLYDEAVVRSAKRLDCLLHTDEYEKLYSDKDKEPMSDELRTVMQGMAGPHARTLWKAYMIRKGLPHDEASYPRDVLPSAWQSREGGTGSGGAVTDAICR